MLIDHMGRICAEKGIEITERALRLLAANADGSVRDGLSILDQCLSAGDRKLDRDIILEFLGTVSEEFFINLTDKVSLHDVAGALVILDEALQEGKDVKQLMKDWMSHYRSLLITKYIKNAEDMLNMSTENIEKLRDQSGQISLDEINSGIVTLSRTINDARYSSQPRILLELAIVTIASGLTEAAPIGKSVRQVQQASVRPQGQPQMAQPAPVGAATAPLQQPQAASVQAAASAQVVLEENGAGNALQQQPQTVQIPNYDLDEIWERIFEEGEDIKGSFNLIRTGAVLAEINDSQFKVIAQNAFTKQYVESNQQQICQLMEKITGKNLKLVCKTEEQNEEVSPHREEAEQLASEVRSKLDLGVDITIK